VIEIRLRSFRSIPGRGGKKKDRALPMDRLTDGELEVFQMIGAELPRPRDAQFATAGSLEFYVTVSRWTIFRQ
jgi:hypothetical protein